MAKQLKLWSGPGYCCRKMDDPQWANAPRNRPPSAYVAAYSRADARRVIEEYCGRLPPDSEIVNHFHEGAWGNSMKGVTPERGLWLGFECEKPARVL